MNAILTAFAIIMAAGFVSVATAVVLIIVLSRRGTAAPRGNPSAALAARQRWNYLPRDPSLVRHWTGAPFVGRGDVSDAIRGTRDGRPFVTFGYEWVESGGEDEVTHRYTVAAVPLAGTLPMLQISPQTGASRLARGLGAQDVQFESQEFNDAFMVSGDEARYVHEVVHPRMMEFLLGSSARGQEIRIDGNSALTWVEGPYRVEAAMAGVELLDGFAERIPDIVYADHGTNRPLGYAGTVTGLRPEPTGRQVLRQAIAIVTGLLWTVGVFYFLSGSQTFGRSSSGSVSGSSWLVIVGLLWVVWGCVRLVQGIVAIRLNRRDRARRLDA